MSDVKDVLKEGSMSVSHLSRNRGRLFFSESQASGRFGRFGLAPFKNASCSGRRSSFFLDCAMISGLNFVIAAISDMKPRSIPLINPRKPILIFTDGAVEVDIVTCGAVVFEDREGLPWSFSMHVPEDIVSEWRKSGDKLQVIAETELLPIIIARELLNKTNVVRPIIQFIDNDGVTFSIIRGTSDVVMIRNMLFKYAMQEVQKSLLSWAARVPSPSNCADAPSRMLRVNPLICDASRDRSVEAVSVCMSLRSTILSSPF